MSLLYSIIFAAVIGLSENTLFDHNLHRDEDVECFTQACRKLGYNIQDNLNKSVDPCIDFYEYNCGNWKTGKSVEQLIWDPIEYKTYSRIDELLVEEKDYIYDKESVIKMAKQFHRSCLNEGAIENEGFKPIKLLLNATGGWPILMSKQEWYRKSVTWQNISNFYYRSYGFSNFFKLTYKRVGQEENRHVVLIQPLIRYLINETEHNRSELNFMTKIVRAFAADEKIQIPEEKLSADVKEVLNFHASLREIMKRKRKQLWRENVIMTIEQLQKFYDSAGIQNSSAEINWLDMLQSTFKDLNVSMNASQLVQIPNRDFLNIFAHILDTTQLHVIVNYIQWNIVIHLMKYANKQLRNIELEYHSRHDVIGQEERWLTCVRSFPMKDIAMYMFIKRYISADALRAASEMINQMKMELKARISVVSWMRHRMKNYMINKIDNIRVLLEYPTLYENSTEIFDFYKDLKIGKDYLENYLAFKRFEAHRTLLNINNDVEITKNKKDWPDYFLNSDSWFSNKSDMIVVPVTLIQHPYFTSSTPLAVNYGAIGPIIAQEFVRSILLEKITLSREDNESSDIITENEEALEYLTKSLCFFEQYNNYTLDMTDEHRTSKQDAHGIIEQAIVDFTGVQIAFTAFRKMKKKTALHYRSKLSILADIPDEQLFFLSYANLRCASIGRPNSTDTIHASEYIKKFRVSGTLANVAYFADAFKCPNVTQMNPISKCTLW